MENHLVEPAPLNCLTCGWLDCRRDCGTAWPGVTRRLRVEHRAILRAITDGDPT